MKELKVGNKMFTQNEFGEYWQAYCFICLSDVFSFKVDDVHGIFEDENLVGRPICKSCYNDLKDKIPEKIDLIKKRFTAKNIFANIEKTHQAPRCKICGLAFPRLNQKTMICDLCKHAKETDKLKYQLDKWL